MQKIKLMFSLFIVLGTSYFAQAQFSGTGIGTLISPYEITTATQLDEMHNYLGVTNSDIHFKLMNDIDLSDFIATTYPTVGWLPIGSNEEGMESFYGFLDGNGFTISNLWMNRGSSEFLGLFGAIKNGAVVNLTIITEPVLGINGASYIGGLTGYLETAAITDCHVQGKISGGDYLGGLIGLANQNATIQNDSATIIINTSGNNIGGLIGSTASPVSNCTSSGTLNTTGNTTGGLVGYNSAPVSNSTSSVTVINTGGFFVGNFMGGLIGSQHATVNNCVTTGQVNGTNLVGGLVGDSYSAVTNSHSTSIVNGNQYVGGLIGASDLVEDSYATGEVTAAQATVGGLVGESYGNIDRCYALGTVNGAKSVGGLVGLAFGSITHSFAAGDVIGTEPENIPEGGFIDFGGLVGNAGGALTNCYATGNVSAPSQSMYVGGLAGLTSENVTNCYASGTINTLAYSLVGGLIGNAFGLVSNCVAANPELTASPTGNINKIHRLIGDLEIDGAIVNSYALESMRINGANGIVGASNDRNGLGKPVAELQVQLTYETNLTWDFNNIWTIREGHGYPYFGYKTYYTSIISSGVDNEEHGTIAPIGDIAVQDGNDKSYTITPAAGFAIDHVLVDGSNAGAINNYTFSNVLANHTIQVVFMADPLSVPTHNVPSVTIYPNPVKDLMNIAYTQNIKNITLYNLLGQEVLSKDINNTSGQIDLTAIPTGNYILKAVCEDTTISSKIIKQ